MLLLHYELFKVILIDPIPFSNVKNPLFRRDKVSHSDYCDKKVTVSEKVRQNSTEITEILSFSLSSTLHESQNLIGYKERR
ncbi:hypothetical protein ASD40_23480 [Paenibacillus sp. Root444D2]|nr:hypothetical protein ASD40_23480 [Paenibacillus sp. Root444D2]